MTDTYANQIFAAVTAVAISAVLMASAIIPASPNGLLV
jgi:hypothetical protein